MKVIYINVIYSVFIVEGSCFEWLRKENKQLMVALHFVTLLGNLEMTSWLRRIFFQVNKVKPLIMESKFVRIYLGAFLGDRWSILYMFWSKKNQ